MTLGPHAPSQRYTEGTAIPHPLSTNDGITEADKLHMPTRKEYRQPHRGDRVSVFSWVGCGKGDEPILATGELIDVDNAVATVVLEGTGHTLRTPIGDVSSLEPDHRLTV